MEIKVEYLTKYKRKSKPNVYFGDKINISERGILTLTKDDKTVNLFWTKKVTYHEVRKLTDSGK